MAMSYDQSILIEIAFLVVRIKLESSSSVIISNNYY